MVRHLRCPSVRGEQHREDGQDLPLLRVPRPTTRHVIVHQRAIPIAKAVAALEACYDQLQLTAAKADELRQVVTELFEQRRMSLQPIGSSKSGRCSVSTTNDRSFWRLTTRARSPSTSSVQRWTGSNRRETPPRVVSTQL